MINNQFKNDSENVNSLRNSFGALRVRKIRDSYCCNDIDLNQAIGNIVEWKNTIEYMVFDRLYQYNQVDLHGNVHKMFTGEMEYKAVKTAKRGNDVYQFLVNKKLEPLIEVDNKIFFDVNMRKKTSLLFLTLTYDTKRCSPDIAWKNIGFEYNLFRANLTKQYGKNYVIRSFESTIKKYPHTHMLIYFDNYVFEAFERIAKRGKYKGRKSFRVSDENNKKISDYWHSNVDVKACEDLKRGVQEVTKYVTKDLSSGSKKGVLTSALLSVYGKQAYSVSKDFGKIVCGIEDDLELPVDLNKEMCNSNLENGNWELVGILPNSIMGFGTEIWDVQFKKPLPLILDAILKCKTLKLLNMD